MRFGGLIAAVVFAAIAAVVVMRMSQSQPEPTANAPAAQEMKATKIYVAAQAIPVGTAITAAMVVSQDWPEHLALPSFVKVGADNANVVGMVARAPFQQNEPIISSKLSNPNDPNFLAGDLPAGMRVVTIPVNEVDGIAGFVFPGDHVDVIYTHNVSKWVAPPPTVSTSADAGGGASVGAEVKPQKIDVTVAETLLTNVKVLAVDQRSSNVGSTDKNGNLVIPRSVSLMASQVDAQRLRLAQKTGVLNLALRSLADKESADPLVLTKQKDISQAKQADLDLDDVARKDGGSSIKITRGVPKQDSTSNFFKMLGASTQPSGAAAVNPAP